MADDAGLRPLAPDFGRHPMGTLPELRIEPGGASTMADGFAVAEAIRAEDGDAFEALATLPWVFNKRHRESDYRFSAPVVETDRAGRVIEIRNTGFLRFFPDMDRTDVPRAYRAVRIFNALCRSGRFLCRTPFAAAT